MLKLMLTCGNRGFSNVPISLKYMVVTLRPFLSLSTINISLYQRCVLKFWIPYHMDNTLLKHTLRSEKGTLMTKSKKINLQIWKKEWLIPGKNFLITHHVDNILLKHTLSSEKGQQKGTLITKYLSKRYPYLRSEPLTKVPFSEYSCSRMLTCYRPPWEQIGIWQLPET